MARVFLDTNILLYAVSEDPRADRAERLISDGGEISVQVLNEFASVSRRKLGFDWPQLSEALGAIRRLCRVHPLDLETHETAMTLAERYGFAVYDSLIVASALRADCAVLYTEDLQADLVVADRLRVVNPFAA